MDFDDKTAILNVSNVAAGKGERRSACFVVLSGGEAGRLYKVDKAEMIIGRAADASIRIVEDGISRRHAAIHRAKDGNIKLSDLGSTNGTFCNGEKVTERILLDGDKIRIGTSTVLKFSLQDDLDEDFQRKQYEWATRDALTTCFNKKYFVERLPSELAYCKRHGSPLSLAMCDIDFFKRINDTYGHQAGDYVLRQVARVLLDTVRQEDTVARWGGEEFALIMRETKPELALVAAERIRKRVEAHEFIYDAEAGGKQRIPVTVSIGIATWVDASEELPEQLVRRADEYLYRAKHNGRNRTEAAERGQR